VFVQPSCYRICGLLVVDFDDEEWPLNPEEQFATAKNVVLAALYVDLDQCGKGAPAIMRSSKVVHQ
jgi:hypothetical protein